MDRPLRNNTLPQTTAGQPLGTQPTEQDVYATAYLSAAMVHTQATTLAHSVENMAGRPSGTYAGLWQDAFLNARKP